MKLKTLAIVCLLILVNLVTCGWLKQKAFVYFNDRPFTEETTLKPVYEFKQGSKIYYLFFSKKKLDNQYIRVQLFKIGDNIPQGAAGMIRVKDYRLMKDEKYYHTNYFVLHQSGRYVVQIYDPQNLNIPLARGEFKVK